MKKNNYMFILFTLCILPLGIIITLFGYMDEYTTDFLYFGYSLIVVSIVSLIIYIARIIQNKSREKKLQEAILNSNISQIDKLNPYDFEEWVARLMRLLGHNAKTTKKSGDYGLDVIAEKDYKKIGIQVKKFNQPVGIKAVQEVLSGITYYDCSEGWVITSANSFTNAAINLANKNNIRLFTRNDLALLLHRLQQNEFIDAGSAESKKTNQDYQAYVCENNEIKDNNPSKKTVLLKINNTEYEPISKYCNDFTYNVVNYLLNKFSKDNYLNFKADSIPYICELISNGKFICKRIFGLLDKENEKYTIYDIEHINLSATFYVGMGLVYLWKTRNNFDSNEALDILVKKNGIQYLDETVLKKFNISIDSEEWKHFNERFYKYQDELLKDFDIDYIFHENDLDKYFNCMNATYILGMVFAIERLNL